MHLCCSLACPRCTGACSLHCTVSCSQSLDASGLCYISLMRVALLCFPSVHQVTCFRLQRLQLIDQVFNVATLLGMHSLGCLAALSTHTCYVICPKNAWFRKACYVEIMERLERLSLFSSVFPLSSCCLCLSFPLLPWRL